MDDLVIRCSGLTKQFGQRKAVDSVGFQLPRGSFLTIFGPNGAGKTTLLRMLAAMIRPSEGEVEVCGLQASEEPESVRAKIGFLGHEPMLYPDLDALQNLRIYGELYGVPDSEARALELLGMVELKNRRYDPVRSFSKGMIQRLAIARALVNDPELLFLDEPYSGLDSRSKDTLDNIIADIRGSKDTSFVMVSHDAQKGFDMATHLLFLSRGRQVDFLSKEGLEQDDFWALYQSVAESGACK